ncbi:MAG: hypothetical protein ACLVJ6_08535 [Merdibacter sp.]
MNAKEAIITALKEYRAITGLRSYLIEDEDDINSCRKELFLQVPEDERGRAAPL